MAFVRIKTVKGQRYAYLVENTWSKRKGAARQKVSKYLGKVITLGGCTQDAAIESGLDRRGIVQGLCRHELLCRGFTSQGDHLKKEGIIFSLSNLRFLSAGGAERNLVLEMNEGFLCKHTLYRLLIFKRRHEDEREDGTILAKRFLEAGLKVPHDAFVRYFEKS